MFLRSEKNKFLSLQQQQQNEASIGMGLQWFVHMYDLNMPADRTVMQGRNTAQTVGPACSFFL